MKTSRPPQRRGGKPVGEHGRRKEPESHLRRDRDDDVKRRVVKGGADGGVVQEAAVVRPADERALASREHLPVEEADVELAEDRVDSEYGIERRGRDDQQVRRYDPAGPGAESRTLPAETSKWSERRPAMGTRGAVPSP